MASGTMISGRGSVRLVLVPIAVFLVMFLIGMWAFEFYLGMHQPVALGMAFVWGAAWALLTFGAMTRRTKSGKAIMAIGFLAFLAVMLFVFGIPI